MSETEAKRFDVPEVLAALEAAVEKRGADYIYERQRGRGLSLPDCLYTHKADDDTLTPGCLVGQVYADLTGSLIPLTPEDQDGPVRNNRHTARTFTPDALDVLSAAQKVQDRCRPWGEALAAAEDAAEV